MKTLQTIFITLMTVLCFSCSNTKDDLTRISQDGALTLERLFVNLDNTELKNSDHVFYLSFKWNNDENLLNNVSIEQKEPDFFVIPDKSFSERLSDNRWIVTCYGSDGNELWSEECNGKFSCGSLIGDCLNDNDDDNCAEICEARAIYLPQIKTFYILQ
ncbi:hypothetical protein ACFQ1M_12400 [Sungkyunkwania multivorans]|uniref:Lipoprotein n=1 Tax=Sungkyunkwania multivorans TaxID=1173618 RepID=A0ABW3D0K0_9FLAO